MGSPLLWGVAPMVLILVFFFFVLPRIRDSMEASDNFDRHSARRHEKFQEFGSEATVGSKDAKMIVINFIWTEEEARRAARETIRATAPMIRFMPIFGLLIFCAPLSVFAMNPGGVRETPVYGWLPPFIFGAWFCLTPLLMQRQMIRFFRRSPDAGLQITWRIDGKSLSTELHGSRATFEWHRLTRIKEAKDGFLLFFHPKVSNWLPKSGFSSEGDLERFREYVAESGVNGSR